jgi:hypothetical protein
MRTPRRAARASGLALTLVALAACGKAPVERTAMAGEPAASQSAAPAPDAPLITIYKSATCGCCKSWVAHMAQNGFRTETHDTEAMDSVKQHEGVPLAVRSCHTGRVGGYVIEGHVPAETVRRLLREKPADIAGLAVPGMVTGSPGMEGPYPEHYQVLAFTRDGATRVYEQH